MAEFYVSLSSNVMASQIAGLINEYNQWDTKHSSTSVYTSDNHYFVEIMGTSVVGCAASMKHDTALSKIQHVCVIPEFRNRGIATKLVNLAIASCDTEYVYMTIRADNINSLLMAQALNFTYIKEHWFKDHYTITVGRRKIHVRA